MKKVLGIGNALVDVLVQVESELILNELQLPKGSMQLINTERYRKFKNASNRSISNLQRVVRLATPFWPLPIWADNRASSARWGHDEMATFFADNCVRHDIKANLLHAEQLPTG